MTTQSPASARIKSVGLSGWVTEKLSQRKKTLASVGAMTGGQVLTAALTLGAGIIQARYIKPDVLGYFAQFSILGGYLGFLHLGTLTALGREYPYWLGRGDVGRARQAASIVLGWVLLVSIVVGAIHGVLALLCLIHADFGAAAGWTAQLVVMSLYFYTLYLACTYRTNSDFVHLSKASVFSSFISVACLPLVAFYGYWGLCLRGSIPVLAKAAMLYRARPVRVVPQLAWRPMWQLVKFGLPIDLAEFLTVSCMYATMASVLAASYGVEILGLFAFARVAEGGLTQFTVSMMQVFAPKINHYMGITQNFSSCVRYSVKLTLVGSAVVIAVTVVAAILCGPFVAWLTPGYLTAVPIMRILLWAGVAPMLALPSHALTAARYVHPQVIGSLVGFALFVTICGIALIVHLPPSAIAWAYLAGKYATVLVLWGFLMVVRTAPDHT